MIINHCLTNGNVIKGYRLYSHEVISYYVLIWFNLVLDFEQLHLGHFYGIIDIRPKP